MKTLLVILAFTHSLSVLSVERNFNLSGTYQYLGDGVSSEGNKVTVVFFPSELRNESNTYYGNFEVPPRPWYVKVPMKTDVVIADHGTYLDVEHSTMSGFDVSNTHPVKSIVELTPMSSEKIVTDNKNQEIVFRRRDGNFIAGQEVRVTVKKLSNGDLSVRECRKGWAPLPFPTPVTEEVSYRFRRK